MASKYRTLYASLGEERVQKVESLSSKVDDKVVGGEMKLSEADLFWLVRRDRNWSEIPGRYR